ncbi:MAG: D-alanyl-D-alanine carboxypeptidase [Alphaproteobacteria bacterium]
MLALVVSILAGTGQALAGYASFVMDADSGQVIHSDGADAVNHPASLTKMMTLYLLFDALEKGQFKKSSPLTVSHHATTQAPSRLGLIKGQTISAEDAILALVTKSANDVASVVAEAIGGSEPQFARMMTDTAHRLGMSRTEFRNASGLPNTAQVSSARDMAILARALLRHFPQHYHYFSTREFRYNDTVVTTHNRLMLSYEGADGLKTGYIGASGFNLVASAKRGGHRLIGVVLGGRTGRWRDQHMADLLDASFASVEGRPAPTTVRVRDVPSAAGIRTASASPDKSVKDRKGKKGRATEKGKDKDKGKSRKSAEEATGSRPEKAFGKVASSSADADADVAEVLEAMSSKAGAKARTSPGARGAASGEEAWGIQIGSFGRSKEARAAARSATAKLRNTKAKDSSVVIIASKVKGATVYKARLVGMTRKQAQDACARVSGGKKSPCHVVDPSGEATVAQAR